MIDGKEAHAFGFLALRRALGLTTSWPEVTGARMASCGGALWGVFAP
jgi:1,6-anhydro-N-acetylmuramate kinase